MKRLSVVLLLCFCSLSIYGQKTRFGQAPPKAKPGIDYPIKVHISGIHFRSECVEGPDATSCERLIYADAVMDGKKIELRGNREVVPFQYISLTLGDYQARFLKDTPKKSVPPIYQQYEVVLPDRVVWRCTVTGISE